MDTMFEHIMSDSPTEDLGHIVPAWEPPAADRQASALEAMQKQNADNQTYIQSLLQQNAETNRMMAQTNQTVASLATRMEQLGRQEQPPVQGKDSPTSAVDWTKLMNQGATAPGSQRQDREPPATHQVDVNAAAAKEVERQLAARDKAYRDTQAQTEVYHQHFLKNFPELVPHYDLVRDRFALEVKGGADMGTAYTNSVAWGKQMLPNLKTPSQPLQVPGGYGGASAPYIPNTTNNPKKEVVQDMSGKKYTIERYLQGILPLVNYTTKDEVDHLKRFVNARMAEQNVKRFRSKPAVLDKYRELVEADEEEAA